jgi:Ca2+-binding EF-hand superfamily protein
MSRPTLARIAIFIAAVAGSSIALAQAGASFDALDANKDGKVSVHEASANDDLFVKFKGLDKNKDGELTREEFSAYKKG